MLVEDLDLESPAAINALPTQMWKGLILLPLLCWRGPEPWMVRHLLRPTQCESTSVSSWCGFFVSKSHPCWFVYIAATVLQGLELMFSFLDHTGEWPGLFLISMRHFQCDMNIGLLKS